ncbi:lariat debranching enzyme, C-terminal domain-containing protein [Suillus paluster]|uniref:lariat debranching enzyme, C-terminal domain-containing protein n=1 Tax=Suillus paluster TaxID=48578 RepID=UPI001B86D97D|nr:lariat debranching enzyme, C-terminal domain-containing protein [Suillus paluster]KAG1753602.1 lariat debranching enzyme, C-terminal domain-containing protein [Suillus paluster]
MISSPGTGFLKCCKGCTATIFLNLLSGKFAFVEGCSHGALDAIYQHLHNLEARHNYCPIRNHRDMQCMAVPQKYRQLGDFHKYYTGERTAPVLTIVIGGNHEASNYMSELYHGGWLAPNIYFLGHAGCVQVNGIRIAGASGIFKSNDFSLGLYERLPYDHGSMRSIYHIREFNVRRLSLLSSPDIFLSHDWPQYIEQHGDYSGQDVQTGNLGSPPLMGLLRTLKPRWWFSAHLHVRFQATNPDEIAIADDDFDAVEHQNLPTEVPHLQEAPQNPDEIILDEEETEVVQPPLVVYRPQPSVTEFLALDKCLPKREFMEVCSSEFMRHGSADFLIQVVDVPTTSDGSATPGQRCIPKFTFDPEWLAITRAFHPFLSTRRRQADYPDEATARAKVAEEMEWVKLNVHDNEASSSNASLPGIRSILDCQTFVQSAPGPGSEGAQKNHQRESPWYTNPQTVAFCDMLDIQNMIDFSSDNRP